MVSLNFFKEIKIKIVLSLKNNLKYSLPLSFKWYIFVKDGGAFL